MRRIPATGPESRPSAHGAYALVAAVALLASFASLWNDFALDDIPLIVGDPRAHSLTHVAEVLTSPYWPEPFFRDLYRPLATLSFSLQWALGGGSPLPFRVTSILLYLAAALAVLALARQLLPGGVALGVGVLFAAHPVHVEAVALGVNQGELWVALAVVGATTAYLHVRGRGDYPTSREWSALALVYALACGFKEHALMLPALLLVAELTLVRGLVVAERASRLALPFAGLAAVGLVFLVIRAAVLGEVAGAEPAHALSGQGVGARTLTMLQVVPEWVRLLAWPVRLLGDYSIAVFEPAIEWGVPQTTGLVVLAGLVALGALHRRRSPVVAFGLLSAGVALVPVSNILVPTTIVLAERTLFLPSVGFLLAGGGVASAFLPLERLHARRLAVAGATVLASLWVVRSAVRHTDWRDQWHFWARTAADAPENHKAHHAIGQMQFQWGDDTAAIRSFHRALTLFPGAYWISHELGDRLRERGHCSAALPLYAESLRVEPDQPVARLSRIECLTELGREEEARAEIDAALDLTRTRDAAPGG